MSTPDPFDCQQPSNDPFAEFAQWVADSLPASEPMRGHERLMQELDALLVEDEPAPHSLDRNDPDPVIAELDRILAAINTEPKIALNRPTPKPAETPVRRAFDSYVNSTCPVRHSPPLPNTPHTLKPYAPNTNVPNLFNHLVPHVPAPSPSPHPWEKATASEKFARAVVAAHERSGLAFTLNLSSAREASLRKSDDPARVMSDRINRALKAAGLHGTSYGFAVELSPSGRMHLHGVVIPASDALDALKRVLMDAGGKISGHAASRQVQLKPLTNGHGWHGYLTKDEAKTRRELSLDKLTFMSSGLRRLTRQHWEQDQRRKLN